MGFAEYLDGGLAGLCEDHDLVVAWMEKTVEFDSLVSIRVAF